MDNHSIADQEFACEDCGFTSPLTNDVCPNCSGRMVGLDAPVKKASTGEGDPLDPDPSEEAVTDTEDSGALSLESLQEQESRDDHDDYSDGE